MHQLIFRVSASFRLLSIRLLNFSRPLSVFILFRTRWIQEARLQFGVEVKSIWKTQGNRYQLALPGASLPSPCFPVNSLNFRTKTSRLGFHVMKLGELWEFPGCLLLPSKQFDKLSIFCSSDSLRARRIQKASLQYGIKNKFVREAAGNRHKSLMSSASLSRSCFPVNSPNGFRNLCGL